jgi:hypothetical protein
MPNQHKYSPYRVRPPEKVRLRLIQYIAETGRKVNEVYTQALQEFLDRHENGEDPK